MVPYNTATVSNPMALRSRWLRVALALAALAAVAPSASHADAQGYFRVTYNVDKTGPTRVELSGLVFNDTSQDVVDVYVTAEALDASGKVLARGIAFVASSIPGRRSSDFSARVPNVRGTTDFRVSVSSFRFGIGRAESP